jgi:predicted transcriptional regulator
MLVPCARELARPQTSRYRDIIMSGTEPARAGSARTKNMVLRLDPALAEWLSAVAEVEGRTVSDVAREAIAALVEARRNDKRFRRLLEDNLARHRRLLDLLNQDES